MAVSIEEYQEWKNCTLYFDLSTLFGMSNHDTINFLISEAKSLKKYAEAILYDYMKTISFMALAKTKPQTENGLRNLISLSNECGEAGRSVEDIAMLLLQYEGEDYPEVTEVVKDIIEWTDDFLEKERIYHSHYLNIVSDEAAKHNFIDSEKVESSMKDGKRSEGIVEISIGIINFEESKCSGEALSNYIELRDSGRLDEFYEQNKQEYQSVADLCKFDQMDSSIIKKFWPWD